MEFVPELALERAGDAAASPYNEIAAGRFRRAGDLREALTYFRLSGRLAEVVYSLNTTNTEFYSYQFKPVLSFLDSPSRGLLIADEVGLGKTIEAGLIWTELRSREDARRLLVLCPAMLRLKWRRELLEKFGIEAEICSAEETLVRLQEAAGGRRREFAVIGSLQGLRPPRGWQDDGEAGEGGAARLAQFLLESESEEPLLDLTIIDEAHYLRNPETQTARLGRLLRPVTENLVMLSATPIQLRNADLFHLLHLLDRDTFQYEWSFESILEQNAPLVRLRDRLLRDSMSHQEFIAALGEALSAKRLASSSVLQHLLSSPPTDVQLADRAARIGIAGQLDSANPLSKVVSRTRKRDVQGPRIIRQPYAIRARLSAAERRFYDEVTERVRAYCARFNVGEGFLLTIPQRQLCSSMPAACRAWRKRLTEAEIEEVLEESFADPDAMNDTTGGPGRPSIQPLISELARIAHEAGDFDALRAADSKFELLAEGLEDYWRAHPDRRVVLFSYFRETLHYLDERLRERGFRCALLMGGMDKDAVLDGFSSEQGARILLSSEVASEGVDLQFASLLINYDLPWNPMRVEQRIGRIDRIGQKADRILIWNLFYEDTLDDRVYSRLFERLRIFEHALGSTEAVLGEPIRQMTFELLRHHLSPQEEEAVIEQTRMAMEHTAKIEDELEREAGRLIEHGGYLQMKINEARDLHRYVTGEDLMAYVRDFLAREFPGGQFVTRDGAELLAEVELSAKGRAEFLDFLQHYRQAGRSRLALPASGRTVCHFENRLQQPRPGREVISQYHPLVRFVTQRLRQAESQRHAPVTAVEIDRHQVPQTEPGTYIFAVQRWSFTGEREIERLAYAAMPLSGDGVWLESDDAERLITFAALRARDWLEASVEVGGEQATARFLESIERLDKQYSDFMEDVARQCADRLELQLAILRRHEDSRGAELRGRIAEMSRGGKARAVKMFEAQLRKHEARCADRRAELERRRQTSHSSRLVAAGAVRVA